MMTKYYYYHLNYCLFALLLPRFERECDVDCSPLDEEDDWRLDELDGGGQDWLDGE